MFATLLFIVLVASSTFPKACSSDGTSTLGSNLWRRHRSGAPPVRVPGVDVAAQRRRRGARELHLQPGCGPRRLGRGRREERLNPFLLAIAGQVGAQLGGSSNGKGGQLPEKF